MVVGNLDRLYVPYFTFVHFAETSFADFIFESDDISGQLWDGHPVGCMEIWRCYDIAWIWRVLVFVKVARTVYHRHALTWHKVILLIGILL